MKNKIDGKFMLTVVGALVAAFMAFSEQIENAKQEAELEEIKKRLSDLEK